MITSASRAPSQAPRRRTAEGVPRAEARIARDLEAIGVALREHLGPRLEALLLVGGYARGEGGVVAKDGELGPYNDYDLLVVTGGRAMTARRGPLLALGHRLSTDLGIEVDLWPIAKGQLSSVPRTLFWLDVALGGVEVLVGHESVLEGLPRFGPRDVPAAEAARLLANRAVGIALSNLERDDHDLRKARHGHKAILACGDARLLAADRYHGTVGDRAEEISRLRAAPAIGDELAYAYADAAAFRVRPDLWAPPGDESLDSWSGRITSLVERSHLSYETLRVGTPPSPAGYANHRSPLFRGAPDTARGPVAALRAWSRGRAPIAPWVGHPRERLARVAVALAYGDGHAGTRAIAARLLGHPGETPPSAETLHDSLSRLAEVGG